MQTWGRILVLMLNRQSYPHHVGNTDLHLFFTLYKFLIVLMQSKTIYYSLLADHLFYL